MSSLDDLRALAAEDGCPTSHAFRRGMIIAELNILRTLPAEQRRKQLAKRGAR